MRTIGKIALIIFIVYSLSPNIVISGYNKIKHELSFIDIELKIKTKNNNMKYSKIKEDEIIVPRQGKKDVGLILPNSNTLILK